MQKDRLFHVYLSYLIQSCLGHRVVLQVQSLLMVGEFIEDLGQGSLVIRELVLQRVVVLFLENAARESFLNKVFNWLQDRGTAADPHDQRVAVAESG